MPTYQFATKVSRTPRVPGMSKIELQLNLIVDDDIPVREATATSLEGADWSVTQKPGEDLSRMASISARLLEAEGEIQLAENIRFAINLRAFEANLAALDPDERFDFSVLALRIGVTYQANLSTIRANNALGLAVEGHPPTRAHCFPQGLAKISFNATGIRSMWQTRRQASQIARAGRELAGNEERLRELDREVRSQRRRLNRLNARGRSPLSQSQAHALRRSIAGQLQERSRLLSRNRALQDQVSRLAQRMNRLQQGTNRLTRSLSRRLAGRVFARVGRNVLKRLIPLVNIVTTVADAMQLAELLMGLLNEQAQIGFEEGADEAVDNPAGSLAEANPDAPDSPQGPNTGSEASRGVSDRGRAAPIADEERGITEDGDTTTAAPEGDPSGDTAATPRPTNTEGTTTPRPEATNTELVSTTPDPMATIRAYYVRFLERNAGRSLPYFELSQPVSHRIRRREQLRGRIILEQGGQRVAFTITITVRAIREAEDGRAIPSAFSYPSFAGFNIDGDVVRVRRGRSEFVQAGFVVREE